MRRCHPTRTFEPPSGRGGKGALTYSASLSYKTDWGLIPYLTNAKSSAKPKHPAKLRLLMVALRVPTVKAFGVTARAEHQSDRENLNTCPAWLML